MTTKEYNGWTNYETWIVKLWMDNSQGDQEYWTEEAQNTFEDAKADHPFTKSEKAKLNLAEVLKDRHEEAAHERLGGDNQHTSWINDLLNAAMSEVNWHEIADSLLTDHCDEYGKESTETAQID